jgi:hypothetical protein
VSTATLSRTDRIRQLNDAIRTTFTGGRVLMTEGVAGLPSDVKGNVLLSVRTFADFDRENDPRGEHDFGSFEVGGATYFFKVDYYSADMQGGSEDAADASKTTRVLTIMRADEY